MKPSLLIGRDTHRELIDLLVTEKALTISGAGNETAKALLLGHIFHHRSSSVLLLTEDDAHADTFLHWLQFFDVPTARVSVDAALGLTQETLRAFLLFSGGAQQVFVAPRSLWDMAFPLERELLSRTLRLAVGQQISFISFVEQLIERGYEHTPDPHVQPGQYRRQGDTLDIFPIQSPCAYRIIFSFDTVESVVQLSQDTSVPQSDVTLFPISYTETAPLMRQFPSEGLLVLDDQDDLPAPVAGSCLRFTVFPESMEHHVHLRYLSVLKFYTLADFLNDVRDKLQQQWHILIVTRRSEELQAIFSEEHIRYALHAREEGAVTLVSADAEDVLPHSIQNPDLHTALLTDREIFSLRKAGRHRSVQKLALDFLTSLSPSDYVVHMEHGIGRFEGMTQKEIDGTMREYLELTYAQNDKLFIPVDQADKLSKYVHEEGVEPVLTRLGEAEWKRITEKIKKETAQIAQDLLTLYAKRASAKGFAYKDDEDVMRTFETAFPYQETPGQRKAIEDIKRDMEDDHPMDRLVCGDVGFGKTEVAMRAAFKAVQDGKQVAVVAPITILADQHYRNFLERMKGFAVRIDMLSRFRTAAEQKKILHKLRKGELDIVIGTHRLLQEDVAFLNLGLVIVDEEQRFGVKQKERFKEMRASVDILTLTATPIPRTLNLGLHKLRDISTITTPPPGRLPIITEVRKYSDGLVRQAILHEIQRGGQVFVLHNRVETIDAYARKLMHLVPEASFIVAHGQLKPDDLEERILSFKEGKHLVLVSSTIIENGIDLPRANTLIVNEAERFGLSQLYQLRGRVGRSSTQAFAYLLYHSQRLQDDAKKRLRAIVEACELGSGFQVAMRDLEIRGAGEILGVSQAGTMNTVGVSHYLRMLKNAVEELKSGGQAEVLEEMNVEILLPVEALIPTYYIPDADEKISVYQKLAGSEDEATLAEFSQDLSEEFGELPRPVRSLFDVLRLKLVCRQAGVHRVKADDAGRAGREIVLSLSPRVEAADILRLLQINPRWKISGSTVRIAEMDLQKAGNDSDILPELTREVKALIRPVGKGAKKNDQ